MDRTKRINAQYNVAQAGGLTDRISTYMRRKMYARFIGQGIGRDDTILDVGVTGDRSQLASNYLEAWYPHKDRVTACGIDDASFLEQEYPGMTFVQADGRDLPFADGSFDWVHSSAVLEHVGSSSEQAKFVSELHRVCRKGVFATTPNRWFPIEFHTVLPLVHWLPKPAFRQLIRRLGHEDLALERNLNLLDKAALASVCRDAGVGGFTIGSVSLCLWPSNLLLAIDKQGND